MLHILILQSLYFMLPAYFANMAPEIFKKINILPFPVDFGKEWKGKRIFGSHKTWGGLVYAAVVGLSMFYLQRYLYQFPLFQQLSFVDYTQMTPLLGFLLGFGAILGDLIESFFKRRVGVEPGKPWIPFDQLDFVVGALVLSAFVVVLPIKAYAVILVVSPLLHIVVDHVAYWLRIRKEKW